MPSNRLVRAIGRIFLLAVLAFGSAIVTARPVEPPLELLHATGNLLIAGALVEIHPAGRLVFARKDVLAGKPRPPELIDVSVPVSVLAEVKLGERYIVGYSAFRTNRQLGALVANLDGPTVLVSIGLEPALFRDTPAIRALLKAGRSERARESRRFYDLVMQALAGSDAQLQNLAAGEIVLDPELRERVRATGQPLVEKVARDPATTLSVRTLLLQNAASRPHDLGDWWQVAAIDVVTTTPLDGYAAATSDPAGLVLAALEMLDQKAVRVAPDALKRWLRSANPSLAERASLMLRRESPALERTALHEALADPRLPAQTRKFLDDHLRRLDRIETGTTARKDGSG